MTEKLEELQKQLEVKNAEIGKARETKLAADRALAELNSEADEIQEKINAIVNVPNANAMAVQAYFASQANDLKAEAEQFAALAENGTLKAAQLVAKKAAQK